MDWQSIISIHMDKGRFGDAKFDGLNFILVGRGFDTTGKGNGWSNIYVDRRATPEQQKAIGGILTTIVSSYKPGTAALEFGKEQRGMKPAEMKFTKSADGLVREIDAPRMCHIKARLAKLPGSDTPVQIGRHAQQSMPPEVCPDRRDVSTHVALNLVPSLRFTISMGRVSAGPGRGDESRAGRGFCGR